MNGYGGRSDSQLSKTGLCYDCLGLLEDALLDSRSSRLVGITVRRQARLATQYAAAGAVLPASDSTPDLSLAYIAKTH
jgi:hypothetical protein